MHWYTKEGKACHFQPDGKETTMRHAREQDLVPSVAGMLNVVDKPGLTAYLINQHLEAAWTTNSALGKSEWIAQSRIKASEHATQARDMGLAIHNAIEQYYDVDNTADPDPRYQRYVHAVTTALNQVYGIDAFNARPEVTFATDSYGGTIDLVSEQFDENNPENDRIIVIDFKYKTDGWEKNKDGTPKKIWYDNHIGQLAAYWDGLVHYGGEKHILANVFISPDAEVYIKEWTADEADDGMEYFDACLDLWKIKNRF